MEFNWSMRNTHIFEVILDADQTGMWRGHNRHLILEALSVEIADEEPHVLRVKAHPGKLLTKLPVQPEQFLLGLPDDMVLNITDSGIVLARELAWRYRLADAETKLAFAEWGRKDLHESLPPDELVFVPTKALVQKWVEDVSHPEPPPGVEVLMQTFTMALRNRKLMTGSVGTWGLSVRRDPAYGWALQRKKLGLIRTVAAKHAARIWPDMHAAPFRVRATLRILGEPEITW